MNIFFYSNFPNQAKWLKIIKNKFRSHKIFTLKDNFNYNKVLLKESVKFSSQPLHKLKISIFYNLRYKILPFYYELKKFLKF